MNNYLPKCDLCGGTSKKFHQGEYTNPETRNRENLTLCDGCYKELEKDSKSPEILNNSLPWIIQKF